MMRLRNFSISSLLQSAVLLVLVVNGVVEAGSEQPPTLRLFQVDGDNKLVKVLSVDPANSEIVLDEGIGSLRLECSADYPVQIVYSGNGIPIMEASIASSSASQFKATALIRKVTEQHTGKWKCASTESPDVLSYAYIYVPGPVLFNTNSGKSLDVSTKQVVIPCTASSPRVSVYLQKPAGDPLERPGEYDPRRGFVVSVQFVEKLEGVYLCRGSYRGITNVLEYRVHIVSPSLTSQRDEGSSKKPQTSAVSNLDTSKSEFEDDEPPCNPPCAENAKCVLQVGGRPSMCQCLAPFKGNAYGSCAAECQTHTDCPDRFSCYADYKCRDPCVHSNHGLQCGRNAVCKTVNHRPTCACPKNTRGDPMQSCSDSKAPGKDSSVQGDAPTRRSTSTSTSRPGSNKRPGNSNSNSDSDTEFICIADTDCDGGKFCNGTVCQDPCEITTCGSKGICTAVNGVGYCSCPEKHRGDPWKRCYAITDKVEKEKVVESSNFPSFPTSGSGANLSCGRDTDCPRKYVCDLEVTRMCMDPCLNCAPNAECDLWDGSARPHCRCPEGYTGDGVTSCYQDVTFELQGIHPSNVQSDIANKGNLCSNTSCGPHSECRITSDGLPKCNCLSNYVGEPPKCKAECTAHTDCTDKQICVLKKCRSICAGKCGRFARCTVDKESRTASCRCRQGYSGDPLVECLLN